KDWGVEPQISVPMDQQAEGKLFQQLSESELHHRPVSRAGTKPTTTVSITTQPIDPQLQMAQTTLIGLIVLQGEKGSAPERAATPATQTAINTPAPAPVPVPASGPATQTTQSTK